MTDSEAMALLCFHAQHGFSVRPCSEGCELCVSDGREFKRHAGSGLFDCLEQLQRSSARAKVVVRAAMPTLPDNIEALRGRT